MFILGISAYYHDSAAVIVYNGEIIAAAQEERFSRKKHDAAFPTEAIKYCLQAAQINLSELSAIVFYDKPLLKFERLLESYYQHAPKGIVSFIAAIPVWIKEKIFLRRTLTKALKKIDSYDTKKVKLLFTEHHLSHAASSFFASSFKESALLTIDGVGEWATATISYGSANSIKVLKELHYPHSAGLLYSAATYFLGFKVNNGEYKVMGLAPYGQADHEQTLQYIQKIKNELIHIYEDGSIRLHQKYFSYSTTLRMIPAKKWENLFGLSKREMDSPINQKHCNFALALQKVIEEIVLKMAATAKQLTGSKNICLAGGVALNCVANGKLKQSKIFDNIFIQPAAGDAGGALGAALSAHYIYYNQERFVEQSDKMKGAYLGPSFSDDTIEKVLQEQETTFTKFDSEDQLIDFVGDQILRGQVIGWFDGRMEYGPRALGNRSILADPRGHEVQQKVNLKVKFRESFRPFAPIILEEDLTQVFDTSDNSPYMLLTAPIKEQFRFQLPPNYDSLPMKNKLSFPKSQFPAISHVDLSSRLQSVNGEYNPKIYALLQYMKAETGIGILLNTSFNIKGEPIVCHPIDALNCFNKTDIDILVMGSFVVKKEQS